MATIDHFAGYVTTEESVRGRPKALLEQALGYGPGSLARGYKVWALAAPVSIDEFDWRDRTRYSAGWHADPTIYFAGHQGWLVQRRDELRSALGKQHNYNEAATDAALNQIFQRELIKLNTRNGPRRIVKVRPNQPAREFPNSPLSNIPQWELKVKKVFELVTAVA